MIDNVKQLIEKTKTVSERVDTSVSTVSDSAKQLLAETQDITASIEAIEQALSSRQKIQNMFKTDGCFIR